MTVLNRASASNSVNVRNPPTIKRIIARPEDEDEEEEEEEEEQSTFTLSKRRCGAGFFLRIATKLVIVADRYGVSRESVQGDSGMTAIGCDFNNCQNSALLALILKEIIDMYRSLCACTQLLKRTVAAIIGESTADDNIFMYAHRTRVYPNKGEIHERAVTVTCTNYCNVIRAAFTHCGDVHDSVNSATRASICSRE